jgi:hypothetical protein
LSTNAPVEEPKKPVEKPAPKHYVRNKDLLPEIIKCKEKGEISNELGRMLLLIVNNYARKGNWANYTYRDDMKGHAMVHLTNAALKFDPSRSNNPFAYYTQVTKNAFIQVLKQERKHRNIRDAKLMSQGLDPSFTFAEHWKAELEAQQQGKLSGENEKTHSRTPEPEKAKDLPIEVFAETPAEAPEVEKPSENS